MGTFDSSLEDLYQTAGRALPVALQDWNERIDRWAAEYHAIFGRSDIFSINADYAVFIWDDAFERVLLAFAVSRPQLGVRDKLMMRHFPDVSESVRKALGDDRAFPADRGHFLGHASGGRLDINLFPQRRDLNRGWQSKDKAFPDSEGIVFRGMEKFVADNLGTFFYHRAIYDDETWVPYRLEYGVLKNDSDWWIESFQNQRPRVNGGSGTPQ